MLERSGHPANGDGAANGSGNGAANGNGHLPPTRRFRPPPSEGVRSNGDSGDVTVGLVGLGYWGPNLLRVLADQPDVRVRWICDQRPARLERMSRRYPAPRATTEL